MSEEYEITMAEAAQLSGLLEEGFPTHKVSLYGLRCYYNCQYSTIWMRWQFFDFLIPVILHTHNALSLFTRLMIPNFKSSGFPLKILDEYKLVLRRGKVDIESRRELEGDYEDEDQAA